SGWPSEKKYVKLPFSVQIVVLDNPFRIWSNPVVQDLFVKAIDLKIRGYGGIYPEGVIPVDTNEFVGTHVLVCRKRGKKLFPITGFRSISLQRCDQHFLAFPSLAIARNSGAPRHAEVVQSIMDRCRKGRIRLEYFGGWTIDPAFRKERDQVE